MPHMNREERQAYDRQWYSKNKTKRRAWNRKRQEETREWFDEFKSTLKCATCLENHPACLDFHHTDPKSKDASLGEIVRKGWGKAKILAEVAKCVVLCANCHRKLHADGRV